MQELLIVKGGTPNGSSNRMIELSHMLEPVVTQNSVDSWSTKVADIFVQLNHGNGGFDELIALFEVFVENDNHIVGSRDYVYRSDQMLMLIKRVAEGGISSPAPLNFFPRTFGLRSIISKLRDKLEGGE